MAQLKQLSKSGPRGYAPIHAGSSAARKSRGKASVKKSKKSESGLTALILEDNELWIERGKIAQTDGAVL